jgi:hypothetical protein
MMNPFQLLLFKVILLFSVFCAPPVFALSGKVPPTFPFFGMPGASSMHGDIASSDTTPLPGPGENDVTGVSSFFGSREYRYYGRLLAGHIERYHPYLIPVTWPAYQSPVLIDLIGPVQTLPHFVQAPVQIRQRPVVLFWGEFALSAF